MSTTPQSGPSSTMWRHALISLALLALCTYLDAARPFGKRYSILFLIPVFYASWSLRGRAEVFIHLTVLITVYIRHSLLPGPVFNFNRITGTLVGFTVIGIMWERRRHINALERVNRELEERVAARTRNLTELNEEFKRLVDVKAQFLRNMSHELRTPLNAIVGVTSLLRDARTETERKELTDVLETSTHLTLGIVNDILDLSQIEAGRLVIDSQPFSLPRTVEEVALLMESEARRKGLTLTHNAAECSLPPLIGDERRIRQILLNIIGNAVKFTARGSVQIIITPEQITPSNVRATIRVRDTGIGIPLEVQSYLFEKFTQADPSIARRFGGSGLGLAITKGLVDLMHGAIGLESAPGKGSTFWVMLHFSVATEQHARTPAVPDEPSTQSPARILVVEDNAINRRLVERFLDRLGHRGHMAASGQEALDFMRTTAFDVVFMDCHMPGMDGYETTLAWRRAESASARRTPIVAMTASVLAEDREACFQAGMDDFLAKPFSLDEFRTMLDRWSTAGAAALPRPFRPELSAPPSSRSPRLSS
ncbi:MAG: response regulator [Bryobacterales bacterium]|nr:response regulator [Bryobacterales bacterium]